MRSEAKNTDQLDCGLRLSPGNWQQELKDSHTRESRKTRNEVSYRSYQRENGLATLLFCELEHGAT